MTRGECELCGKVMGKAAMTRHLQGHMAGGPGSATMVHLLVDHGRDYWMHLVARGDATLAQLDALLRREWLECCDHLSQFRIGGDVYASDRECATWGGGGMDAALADVLGVGLEFSHEYDMGSTTTLRLRVVGAWRGDGPPVRLLAINDPPERPCVVCGRPADVVCIACYEGPHGTVLCAGCAGAHGCDEDYRRPLANSPRCGVCGYTGY